MNPYAMLGSGIGTNEAASLSARLSAWHDAMVAHERRLRTGTGGDVCDDECPHAEARALWSEAVAAFGPRAEELAFLRSRATEVTVRAKRSSPERTHQASVSDAPPRAARGDGSASSGHSRRAAEV
jgi:hypothetical protein